MKIAGRRVLFWVALAGPGLASLSAWGGETAHFLKIGAGARPIGMGGAFTAVADDVNALTTNPAGLGGLKSREVGFTHAELFGDVGLDFAAYAHPLSPPGGSDLSHSIAAGITRLAQGALEGRDSSRQKTSPFSASDLALQVGYGISLPGGIGLGGGFKFLKSEIGSARATGWALDLGAQTRLGRLGLGVAAQNLGPGLKFDSERGSLPTALSVGASYPILRGLVGSADFKLHTGDGKTEFGFGTEAAVLPMLTLRAGYLASALSPGGLGSSLTGLGAGFGLKFGVLSADYAFVPYGELGSAQRFSLGARF